MLSFLNNFLFHFNVPYPLNIFENDLEDVKDDKIANNTLTVEKTLFTPEEYDTRYNKRFESMYDTDLTSSEKKEVESQYNEELSKIKKSIKDKIEEMEKALNDKIKTYEDTVNEEKVAIFTKKPELQLTISVKKKDIKTTYDQINKHKDLLLKVDTEVLDLKKTITRNVLKNRIDDKLFICEYVPRNGNVIFYYNAKDDMFCYYSNYNMTSHTLDILCKSFCIKNGMKELFLYEKLQNAKGDIIYKPNNKYLNVGRLSGFNWLVKPPAFKSNVKTEMSWKDYKKSKSVA